MLASPDCKMNRTGIAFIVLFALFSESASAQLPFGQKPSNTPRKSDDAGVKTSAFTIPVDMPDVPAFSGKCTLVFGNARETEQGIAYIQSFTTPEPAESVIAWYESALSGRNWKISRKSGSYISARQSDGGYCSISVQKPVKQSQKEFRCIFDISYFKFHRHRQPSR